MRSLLLASVLVVVGCGAGSSKDSEGTPLDGGGSLGGDADLSGFDAADPDAPYDPDAACAARSFGGKKLPLTIAITFDESSSMSMGGRMTTAQAGLKKALGDAKFDDVNVALFRFGFIEGLNGCNTDTKPFAGPVALGTGRTDFFAAIDKLAPSGATPTYGALNDTYAWLAPQIADKKLDGKVAVVLVTDGAPTCGSHLVSDYGDLVKKGRAATIDTFVIGLPGSGETIEDDPDGTHSSVLLTKIAWAGTDAVNLPPGCDGTPSDPKTPVSSPCYYDLAKSGLSADSLATALDSIRKATQSCEYALPAVGDKYDLGNPGVVVVDASGVAHALPKCTDPKSPPAGGCWGWSDAGKTKVKIYGAACDLAKSDDKARVDVLLQCRVK